MYKPGKPFLTIEVNKEKKGTNKFLYSFFNDNSEESTGELSAESGFQGQIDLKAVKALKEIYCILPPEVISFKTLSFPFKLKNGKQILSLIGPALEEQNPLLTEDLSIAYTKLNENSVFAEYIRKDKINKIYAELDNLIGKIFNADDNKIKIKFFSPYSLMYKISAALNPVEGSGVAGGRYMAVYRFNGYSYGILFENNNLKDIINFNLPFNEGLLETPDYLGTAVVNPEGDLKSYLAGKNAIKNGGLPGSFASGAGKSSKKGILSFIALNYKRVFAISMIFLFLVIAATIWQIQSFEIKSGEKAALQIKMNSILSMYMPDKKVFYEPRFEIKNYYDSLKKSSFSENAGIHFLDFVNYLSESKLAIKGVRLEKINYSMGRFALTGTVPDYSSLNKLEKYLKKRYSDINVVKSTKTSSIVSFIIYLKKK